MAVSTLSFLREAVFSFVADSKLTSALVVMF